MKRINNLYSKIYDIENLQLADTIARKGKLKQPGVLLHDKNRDANLLLLQDMFISKTYQTSAYTTFKIYEPKEREISRLPYFPDRIAHHAVMNVLEAIFTSTFTTDTYSCIKGKGLKIDIKKFYPNIDHNILKALLRRKIKDNDLLWLLDGIIDSADGLPIGNYLSQYFANFYLTGFDHWLKETKRVRYYFRYADDIVILSDSKSYLHQLLSDMREYLLTKLNLTLKHNYQVFPVAARGIDFVGYVFYHTHTLLRKGIKQNYAREMAGRKDSAALAGYKGWADHCNSKHLVKKLTNEHLQTVTNKQYEQRL